MIRHGRYGEFTACSGYPECKYVKQNSIGVKCPKCKDGEIVEKRARKGNTFYGCSNYPKCNLLRRTSQFPKSAQVVDMNYLVEKQLQGWSCDRVPEQGMRLRTGRSSRGYPRPVGGLNHGAKIIEEIECRRKLLHLTLN